MVTEIWVSAVFRVIFALRIRSLIYLLQGGYIPVGPSAKPQFKHRYMSSKFGVDLLKGEIVLVQQSL